MLFWKKILIKWSWLTVISKSEFLASDRPFENRNILNHCSIVQNWQGVWFSSPHWTLKQPKSSLASFYYNWQPHTQPSIVDWSGIPNNMSSCVTPLKSKVVLMVGWVVLFRKVTIQKTKVYVHINFTWGVRGVFYEFF